MKKQVNIKYKGKTYCVPYMELENLQISSEEMAIERIIDEIICDSLYEFKQGTYQHIQSLREEIDGLKEKLHKKSLFESFIKYITHSSHDKQ